MHPAQQYIEDVLSGELPACRYIKWAVQRHKDDLEKSEDEDYPYYFDPDEAQWYIDLFQFFVLYEGEAAGKPFDLHDLPWIQFQVWCLFGWKRKKNDKRRFRKGYVLVAKKNIKTTFAGCLGLIGLLFDGESGAQVYSAASNAKQARICFRAAREIARKSPAIRKRLEILTNNISYMETASFFEYISSQSAQTKDGLNPHFSIIDEYHAHPDNEVHDVLDSATAAREQPLVYIISTEGFNQNGPHADLRDYCIDVLDPNKKVQDDTIFFLYYTLDKDDDWEDEENWIKANPSLGVSVKMDDLRAKAKTAKQLPSSRNNFLTKHMNVPVDAEDVFIPSEKWAACNKRDIPPPMHNMEKILDKRYGNKAFPGLDLGSVSDFTAFVAVVWMTGSEDWDIIPFFWIPEENIRERKHGQQIADWVREGYIGTTPGTATDHDFTEEAIKYTAERLDIRELPYDRYKADQIVQHLMAEGIEMVPFNQTPSDMGPAIDSFERLILQQKINHGGNPVLEWMLGNVATKSNAYGYRQYDKRSSGDKIDGIVAATMGAGRAMLSEAEGGSVYDERGMITI